MRYTDGTSTKLHPLDRDAASRTGTGQVEELLTALLTNRNHFSFCLIGLHTTLAYTIQQNLQTDSGSTVANLCPCNPGVVADLGLGNKICEMAQGRLLSHRSLQGFTSRAICAALWKLGAQATKLELAAVTATPR